MFWPFAIGKLGLIGKAGNIWGEFAETEKTTSAQLSTVFNLVRKNSDLEHQVVIGVQPDSNPILCWSEDSVSPSKMINDIPDENHRLESPSTGGAGWGEKRKIHTALSSFTTAQFSPRVSTLLDELVQLCLISRAGRLACHHSQPLPVRCL